MSNNNMKWSDKVKRVEVSEASRKDAKGIRPSEVKTDEEELKSLKLRKQQIESELVHYSKASFQQAQFKYRKGRSSGRSSMDGWLKIKGEMQDKRTALVQEKQKIEMRMSVVRGRISQKTGKSDPNKLSGEERNVLLANCIAERLLPELEKQTALLEDLKEMLRR